MRGQVPFAKSGGSRAKVGSCQHGAKVCRDEKMGRWAVVERSGGTPPPRAPFGGTGLCNRSASFLVFLADTRIAP